VKSLPHITLISFGYFDNGFLKDVAEAVKREFCCEVSLKEGYLDLIEFYDPVRRQYNGTRLLNYIEENFATDTSKSIGLFSVDLFIPILTYIFGQAFLNGRSGIASDYRLSNIRYGIAADERLLLERFSKEVIHELGHTFGLIHCHVSTCVMRSGTYVEDIDQKEESFCPACREAVNQRLV
jgi:archaemetzincin